MQIVIYSYLVRAIDTIHVAKPRDALIPQVIWARSILYQQRAFGGDSIHSCRSHWSTYLGSDNALALMAFALQTIAHMLSWDESLVVSIFKKGHGATAAVILASVWLQ